MLLRLHVRDLVIASWPTTREAVAQTLPAGLEPVEIGGGHIVSVVALRYTGGRLGLLPVPPFSQLNVRVYVAHGEERAVFFLAARVSPPGLGGVAFGAPYRPARLRFRAGRAEAPGLGFSLAYAPTEPADPGELGAHEFGLFEAAGLRSFRVRRMPAEWQRAEAEGPIRADLLLAHGFELLGPPELLYARRAGFEAELPPRKISSSRSRR